MKYPSALAAVLIAVTGPASATEYLSNGGFETSFFSPWDLEDIPGTDSVVATDNDFLGLDYGAESGGWFVVGAAFRESSGEVRRIAVGVRRLAQQALKDVQPPTAMHSAWLTQPLMLWVPHW